MARGKKTCKACGHETGPRSHRCPKCDTKFSFAYKGNPSLSGSTKISKEKLNWRNLEKGQYIKSIGGTGPFYPIKTEGGGYEPVPIGHYGIFRVQFVDDEGIGAYEINKNRTNGGFCYLYMGKPKPSRISSAILRPHKIKRVIRRVK